VRLGPGVALRAVATATVLARLARAARTRPSVGPPDTPLGLPTLSVVVPARDEAGRIGPLLARLRDAPGVTELIVVDDESTDDTARLAAEAGAQVVSGVPRPTGWAGKPWALQQGVDAATGEWIVTLDADTRPDPLLPAALVARALADAIDLVTAAGRFDCPTAGARWLHPAMLTTLVYRFGPPGAQARPAPDRLLANGQCTAFRRAQLLAAGGFEQVSGEVVEDVALARRLAARGWSVEFVDAAELLTVRMYDTLAETWSGWGRSIALPGVEPRGRQLVDLVALALTMPLPLIRLLAGRADAVDLIALAARIGTLAGTRSAYERIDAAYWASPLADGAAVAALAIGMLRRRHVWRGRTYAREGIV
jgi:dolichol-phosphate mannosyltransferase